MKAILFVAAMAALIAGCTEGEQTLMLPPEPEYRIAILDPISGDTLWLAAEYVLINGYNVLKLRELFTVTVESHLPGGTASINLTIRSRRDDGAYANYFEGLTVYPQADITTIDNLWCERMDSIIWDDTLQLRMQTLGTAGNGTIWGSPYVFVTMIADTSL